MARLIEDELSLKNGFFLLQPIQIEITHRGNGDLFLFQYKL